jgi:hypothetical protein
MGFQPEQTGGGPAPMAGLDGWLVDRLGGGGRHVFMIAVPRQESINTLIALQFPQIVARNTLYNKYKRQQ